MITQEQWPKVKEIVGAALECPAGELGAFLDEVCIQDEELRSEVLSLLAAYHQAGDLSGGGWDRDLDGCANVPAQIGPYRLQRELGAGGMGQVWLAEQTAPVRRYVALKLIRAGLADAHVAQRFIAERQSLALMNHPAIAKVYDAGTTPAGQPYLVMEYVDGCSITEYCDRNKLQVRDRLKLFQLVCDGVQHAHQKAILHRDLKPSNILVTEVDGHPMPRIIDFGVAKVLSPGMDAKSLFTQAGSVLGTLGYMSPEQADSGGEDIDTRSDVYSLGVVLYELLVGALPLDVRNLTYYEVLRQLREQDAPRPSTRLRGLVNEAETAQQRSTEKLTLVRQLRGDADAIALKALERDRIRRYSSPSDLAADIGRYLSDEPVLAHPPGVPYLLGKYVRRHRVGVIAAAAGMLLLLGFSVAQTIQLRNVQRQRDRADRITAFMTSMFKVADPSESRGNSVTAREILDKSSTEIEAGLGLDSVVQSQLMTVMAETYRGLGLYARAHTLAERALENRRKSLGPEDPKTLESMKLLGSIFYDEGHNLDAETLLRKTVALQSRVLGPADISTLETEDALASLLVRQAHDSEAENLERGILAVKARTLGSDSLQTFRSMNTLASALRGESRFDEAEKVFRDLLARELHSLGPDHPYILVTMHDLANVLAQGGRYDEAEVIYQKTLAIQRRVLGPEHPETASTMTTLANTLRHGSKRKAEAEALYRQAIQIELRVAGPENAFTTRAEEGLANVLSDEHRYDQADPILREVLRVRRKILGPGDTDLLLTQYNLGDLLFKESRIPEAENLLRKTLDQQARVLDAHDPDTLASKALLARILLKEDRAREAEEFARQAFTTQLKELGPQHDDTQDSLSYLTEAMVRLGRYKEAQALYTSTIRTIESAPKGDASSAWYNFADMAAIAGHNDDAFSYLRQSIQAGFTDVDNLRNDDELKTLRKDPRFAQVILTMQKRTSLSGTR